MTGSIKDRMAYHILSSAIENGRLEPEMQIFEATSGNTGISFSALGTALGHKVKYFYARLDERRAQKSDTIIWC